MCRSVFNKKRTCLEECAADGTHPWTSSSLSLCPMNQSVSKVSFGFPLSSLAAPIVVWFFISSPLDYFDSLLRDCLPSNILLPGMVEAMHRTDSSSKRSSFANIISLLRKILNFPHFSQEEGKFLFLMYSISTIKHLAEIVTVFILYTFSVFLFSSNFS